MRPKRLLWGLLFLFLAGTIAGARFYLEKLPYFSLRRVEINLEGEGHISKKEVIELSGLRLGVNLFSLDLKQIKEKIEAHPWVAKVFVSRELPSSILIKVEEEIPVAMVSTKKGVYLVNAKGKLFALAPSNLMKELPALAGLSREEIEKKELLPARLPVLALLSLLQRQERWVPCFANLSQIKFLEDGFILLTRDAIRVRFKGESLEEFKVAYQRLDRILAYLYRTKQYSMVEEVRLDYPQGQAAIAFRKG